MLHKSLVNAFRKEGYEVKQEVRPAIGGRSIVNYFVEDGAVICQWAANSPEGAPSYIYVVNRLREDPRHVNVDYWPGKFTRTIKETIRVFKEEAASQSFTDKPDIVWPKSEGGWPEAEGGSD